MNFECLININPFEKNDQKVNVLISEIFVYKNGNQFLIEAEVKNAETLKVIKQIATNFVPENIDGDLKTQAVDYLKLIFRKK